MEITTQILEIIDEQEIHKISLINDNGFEVGLLTLGATWQEFLVPQIDGSKRNIIIGFDKPSDYKKNTLCAGQSIGRVAGRIDKAIVTLDGHDVQVPQNEKGNCLHGGPAGFHTQVWEYRIKQDADAVAAVMTYYPKEKTDGFPGDMKAEVIYALDNANRLTISYTGSEATKTTLFNPTNHVYFNLSDYQDLHTHDFVLESSHYLETRDDLVPTGKILSVDGSSHDFREGQNLGQAIDSVNGFDTAFIVAPSLETPVGILRDSESGGQISLFSDRNAWLVYTMGGVPSGIFPSRDSGKEAKEFEAVALEAQFLPDAIHHDHFGDVSLSPNESKTYTIAFEYKL
jgi:aldose 1-epimerase